MRGYIQRLLIILISLAILNVSLWFFRVTYIFYYHIGEYLLFSSVFLIIILILALKIKNVRALFLFAEITMIVWFLSSSLSMYPNLNNSDVLKMAKVTSLFLEGITPRAIDYGAFPGYSFLLGVTNVVTEGNLSINFHYIVFECLSLVLLLFILLLQRDMPGQELFPLVLFSSGFVLSFYYLSPQFIGLVLAVALIFVLLKSYVNQGDKRYQLVGYILFVAVIMTHAETTLTVLLIITFYYLGILFLERIKNRTSPMRILVRQLSPFYIILFSYVVFTMLKNTIMTLFVKGALTNLLLLLQGLSPKLGTKIGPPVSFLKPEYIQHLDKLSYAYNLSIATFVLYFWTKHRAAKKGRVSSKELSFLFLTGWMLLGVVFAMGIFFIINRQFLFRPIFYVSLFTSILFSVTFERALRVSSFKHREQLQKGILVIIFAVFLLISFPSRIYPYEGNVYPQDVSATCFIPWNASVKGVGWAIGPAFSFCHSEVKGLYGVKLPDKNLRNEGGYIIMAKDYLEIKVAAKRTNTPVKYLEQYWNTLQDKLVILKNKVYDNGKKEIWIG